MTILPFSLCSFILGVGAFLLGKRWAYSPSRGHVHREREAGLGTLALPVTHTVTPSKSRSSVCVCLFNHRGEMIVPSSPMALPEGGRILGRMALRRVS